MTEQQTGARAEAREERTVYTAYELDFFLRLDDTPAAAITREQMSLQSAPAEAAAFVEAAVTSGLYARERVHPGEGGAWLLSDEAQVIATNLTRADRWLGMALTDGSGMRLAFIVATGDAVLMYTQDELDAFRVSAVESRDAVPEVVANVSRSFLSEAEGRTVSLRRTDVDVRGAVTQLMLHVEEGGAWRIAHEPLDAQGDLTVSDLADEQIQGVVRRLWADDVSEAPGA